jgi:CTP synthase (UTP-ammonia lyase)
MAALRIGVVGDFSRGKHSHWATEAALFHAAARLGIAVEPVWLPTEAFESRAALEQLRAFDGVWAAPGSPYRSGDGMLNAIGFAREQELPFLGTCGGFQYSLIELTRSLLGEADANTAEDDPHGPHIVITLMSGESPSHGNPKLSGENSVSVAPGSLLSRLCGDALRGEFFCSYETNPAYVPRLEAVGVRFPARDEGGAVRAMELASHRFFLTTLFQPQLSSTFTAPHPIVLGYLRACRER